MESVVNSFDNITLHILKGNVSAEIVGTKESTSNYFVFVESDFYIKKN